MTEKEMPKKVEIEPLDYARCQAEITTNVNAHNFLQMGGRIGGTQRCEGKPQVVVTERQKGKDGQKGQMTLCPSCLKDFKQQKPDFRDFYTLVSIDGIFKYRWDELPDDTKRLFEAHGLKKPG